MAFVLDNSAIERMLAQPAIFGQIPCLRNPPRKEAGCGSCGSNSQVDYNAIKACLAGMDPSFVTQLKQLLGVREIQLFRATTHRGNKAAVLHKL